MVSHIKNTLFNTALILAISGLLFSCCIYSYKQGTNGSRCISFHQDEKQLNDMAGFSGKVIWLNNQEPVHGAIIKIIDSDIEAKTDTSGIFNFPNSIIPLGNNYISVSAVGCLSIRKFKIQFQPNTKIEVIFALEEAPVSAED